MNTVYLLRFFGSLLLIETASGVIQGTYSESDVVSFSVAVVYCVVPSVRSTCYAYCSGSLIAPDVVLTAGHCVNDADKSTFKASVPPYPLSNVAVIVGSRNPRLGTDGVLVPAKSVINAGYSRSSAIFDIDDDLGLIFLSQCVQLVPGSITTAKVATLSTEPASPNAVITIQGHGINANIPDQIRTDDSTPRYMKSALQTHDVCINAAVYISLQLQGVDPSVLDNPLYAGLKTYYFSQFVREKTICAGGNAFPYSICHGDSGGGWIDNTSIPGVNQIIGVVSFQIDSSKTDSFCGYSPGYGTRVAFYASWIKEKILANSLNCAGWDISQTFASPNVDPMLPSQYSQTMQQTRCTPFTQFQCFNTRCTDWSQVCNGQLNCGVGDNSDEDPSMCAGNGPVLHADIPDRPKPVVPPRPFDAVEIPPEIPRKNPFEDLFNVPNTRAVDPVIGSLTCTTIVDYMKARIAAERAEGLNRAEYDTSVWTSLCTKYGQCALRDSSISPFCDAWNLFMSRRAVAQSISSGFNARFGSTTAAPDFPHPLPLPALDMAAKNTSNVSDSTSNSSVASGVGPVPFAPNINSTAMKEASETLTLVVPLSIIVSFWLIN